MPHISHKGNTTAKRDSFKTLIKYSF